MGHLLIVVLLVSGKYIIRFRFCKIAEKLADPPLKQSMDFSSYKGHMERRTGKIRGAFSRMHRALDGWMLARAPASPAQGLHHHGPRYFNFPYFCTMCGLEKLGLLVDQNWLERICPICC